MKGQERRQQENIHALSLRRPTLFGWVLCEFVMTKRVFRKVHGM